MMASSPRAVLTGQRKITARVYVTSFTIILLYLSISVESSIHSVQERFTARVGDTVNIPFEYCGLPKPLCTLTQSFNLSTPNPTCTVDRYGHCEVLPAPDDDPFRDDLLGNDCELCVLAIHGVTQKDAGRYAICEISGACTSSFWSTISTLKVVSGNEEPPTPTSMSTKVSTKPTTEEKETASLTTEAVELIPMLSTKYTGRIGNNDTHLNKKREHPARDIPLIAGLTVVGVFFAVLALVAVIWKIRRVLKRRQRSESHDQDHDLPGHPMGSTQSVEGNVYTFHSEEGPIKSVKPPFWWNCI